MENELSRAIASADVKVRYDTQSITIFDFTYIFQMKKDIFE